MPKRVTQSELKRIEDVVLRFPAGVSLAQLQGELRGAISRRTLSRRLADMLEAGRIRRRGEGRATRYLHGASKTQRAVSPQFETADGVVTIDLPAVSRDILEYVSRPAAARPPRGYERRLLDDYV